MYTKYLEISARDPGKLEKIIEDSTNQNEVVIGLEVVSPVLDNKLSLNIDPQHKHKDTSSSAILEVYNKRNELIEAIANKNLVLVTERPDLDSVGAMVLLNLFQSNHNPNIFDDKIIDRIKQINHFDNAISDGKWSPKSFEETMSDLIPIGGIHTAISDRKLILNDKVQIMKDWLLTGTQPQAFLENFNAQLSQSKKLVEDFGNESFKLTNRGISFIDSDVVYANKIGYTKSPVIIMFNDHFSESANITPYKKYTICQYEGGDYINFRNLMDNLNAREKELGNSQGMWGGGKNIIGSPMKISSLIPVEEVTELTEKNLNSSLDIINKLSNIKPLGVNNTELSEVNIKSIGIGK